jgi:hypothetical protein
VYLPSEPPFGKPWSTWAAIWCNWLLSIPKTNNPALDNSGRNASVNQVEPSVWFLAGTFGNEKVVHRKCKIPKNTAILFPTMLKECSFAEDKDLHTEPELVERSKNDMDMVTSMEVMLNSADPKFAVNIPVHRCQSNTFDLIFPPNNVYDVSAGLTRSTCNGYWVFLRPLTAGSYQLFFRVEAAMPDGYVVTEQIRTLEVYKPIKEYINKFASFKIEIRYDMLIK